MQKTPGNESDNSGYEVYSGPQKLDSALSYR